MNEPGREILQLLTCAVLVPADIGHEDRVVGRDLRRSRGAAAPDESGAPCPAGSPSARLPRPSRSSASAADARLVRERTGRAREDDESARGASPSRRRPGRPRRDRSCRSPAARCRSESGVDGGIANVKRGSHELQSASPKAVPTPSTHIGRAGRGVGDGRAPDAAHAERQRMPLGKRALAHERRRDGNAQQLGELTQLVGRLRQAARRCRRRSPAARRTRAAARRRQCRRRARRTGRIRDDARPCPPARRSAARRRPSARRSAPDRAVPSAPGSARAASRRPGTSRRRRARRACRSAGRCRPATHRHESGCPDAAPGRGDTTACCRQKITIGVESAAAVTTPVSALVSPGDRCTFSDGELVRHAVVRVGRVRRQLLVPE